jgi:hypothetical protein
MLKFEKAVKTPTEAVEFMNVTLAEQRQAQGNPLLQAREAILEAVVEDGTIVSHVVKFGIS